MRSIARWLGIAAIVGVPLLLEGYGTAEPIDHGDYGLGSQVPDGSGEVCEALPEGVPFIPELRSGWAVAQPDSQTLRLVFSNAALECSNDPGASIAALTRECVSAWSYSLLVPASLLQPGTYDLADYPVTFSDDQGMIDRGAGCGADCAMGMTGGGNAPGGTVEATLEIYNVSEDCITGRITGLTHPGQIQPPPPEDDGGFHTVRCTP